jgi:tripartite-type tricarboxylate transporter receptor subunit TctC
LIKENLMLSRFVAGLFLFALAGTASAQFSGARPITLVVGFPPGGGNDLAARVIAPELGKALGTNVIITNKPGANATIGADYVAKSAPDGHTLLVVSASPLVIVPHTSSNVPFDTLRDFAPISIMGVTPGAIAVNVGTPARNLKQFLESSVGKPLRIGSTGNGGMPHLTIELLKRAALPGVVIHVPYKGAAPAMTDVMGGHIEGFVGDLASVITLVKDGKLRAMAVTSRSRVDYLPDAPTAAEQGFPTLHAENWLGVFAAAKTPPATVDRLHAALIAVAATPQVRDGMLKIGYAISTSASPAAFHQFLREEYEKWGKIAKESGAKAD